MELDPSTYPKPRLVDPQLLRIALAGLVRQARTPKVTVNAVIVRQWLLDHGFVDSSEDNLIVNLKGVSEELGFKPSVNARRRYYVCPNPFYGYCRKHHKVGRIKAGKVNGSVQIYLRHRYEGKPVKCHLASIPRRYLTVALDYVFRYDIS